MRTQLNKLHEQLRTKQQTEKQALKWIQKKFPAVQYLYLYEYSIEISTEHNTGTYPRRGGAKVSMQCNDRKMPDTVEEFLQAKQIINSDADQCLRALYYIGFRYFTYEKRV